MIRFKFATIFSFDIFLLIPGLHLKTAALFHSSLPLDLQVLQVSGLSHPEPGNLIIKHVCFGYQEQRDECKADILFKQLTKAGSRAKLVEPFKIYKMLLAMDNDVHRQTGQRLKITPHVGS